MIHNLLQLAPQAMAASTLCVCETSGGKSDADILWCKDCGLCICRECANKQVNLSCHSMEPFEIARCDPVTLEMKLWSTVEPTLCFRHDDIPEGKYEFLLKSIERTEQNGFALTLHETKKENHALICNYSLAR